MNKSCGLDFERLDDPPSLDFQETLALLAGWQGRRVTVTAYSGETPDHFSATNVRMHGRLGEADLGGARHPSNPPINLLTTASFAIGPARPGDSFAASRSSRPHKGGWRGVRAATA